MICMTNQRNTRQACRHGGYKTRFGGMRMDNVIFSLFKNTEKPEDALDILQWLNRSAYIEREVLYRRLGQIISVG